MIDRSTFISLGLALSLLAAAVTGGIAWGQMDERVDQIEEKVDEQQTTENKLHEIDKRQGQILVQQKADAEARQKFEDSTTETLKEILQQLKAQ